MKLTTIKWVIDALVGFLGRSVEIFFRLILLCLPLWVYLLIIQRRTKVSSTSNLSLVLDDNSVWQRIYPGFILVAQNKNQFNAFVAKVKGDIQSWVNVNKYLLLLSFGMIIVILMILDYIK